MSGTITQDVVKFRALQFGEDGRFCDLDHLVKPSFSILKERFGREHQAEKTTFE